MSKRADELRAQILALTAEYQAEAFEPRPFVAGRTPIPVTGKVVDGEEVASVVESALDGWFTTGTWASDFERKLARFVGVRSASMVNSGSSANLIALSTLCSPKLGARQLKPGDEVITVAAAFPTTVNPIVQNRLVPVFVDISAPTWQLDVAQLEAARSDRTRAVMLAHTLGNTFDADPLMAFCKEYNLWLVEDAGNALGSTYKGRQAGTFGDLATLSFYPSQPITTGEGGAVLTAKATLQVIAESFRDWGRDCWCPPGIDNTCGRRFEQQLGTLPCGYDHKFTYSHIGYNCKATDMQAALGNAQMDKLPGFVAQRKANFAYLREQLAPLEDLLVLPEATEGADPSWFGFPLGVRDSAPFQRDTLTRFLEAKRVGTRLLFAGNLTRQPAYAGCEFRSVGELPVTEWAMNRVFWIGVYPGLTAEMLAYTVEVFHDFAAKVRAGLIVR